LFLRKRRYARGLYFQDLGKPGVTATFAFRGGLHEVR